MQSMPYETMHINKLLQATPFHLAVVALTVCLGCTPSTFTVRRYTTPNGTLKLGEAIKTGYPNEQGFTARIHCKDTLLTWVSQVQDLGTGTVLLRIDTTLE